MNPTIIVEDERMNEMKIKRGTVDDIEKLAILFNDYRKFYEQESDLDGARAFIEARLRKSESIVFLVVDGEEALGFVQLYPTFSSVAMKQAYILNDLFVVESARKRGVAQQLIEQCYTYCEDMGARYITLETAESNTKAQALYEKMGMHTEPDVRHYSKYWS